MLLGIEFWIGGESGYDTTKKAMSSPTPPPIPGPYGPMPPTDPNQKKKTNIVVWVLLGIAAFIVVGGIVLVGGAVYFVKQVAGSGNPGMAIAKVITALNPDLEVISMDGETVKVRVKSTGEEAEVNLSDLQRGKIDIKTKDGRVVVGGKGKIPDWLPKYPGMKGDPIVQVESQGNENGNLVYQTNDNASKVSSFYESEFKVAGFTVTSQSAVDGEEGVVITKADSGAKSATIKVIQGNNKTVVSVKYSLSGSN